MSIRSAVASVLFLSLACASGSSPASNEALVRSLYDSFARGDAAAVLARLDPDVVWSEAENTLYADRNPYRGPQAVAEGVFGRLMSDLDNFRIRIDDIVAGQDRVVALGRYTGTWKATSRPIDAQFAHVWTVRNGRVVAFQQYTDTAQFARARAR